MPNIYNSTFTGTHNDQYNVRITTLENKTTTLENKTTSLESITAHLPATTSGSVGQYLSKINTAGDMGWKTVELSTCLFFEDKQVATTSWVADTTYNLYPYKADISLTGVTTEMYPEVIFNLDEAISGYFAPLCQSYAGGVRIYASDIPPNDITIPTIVLIKN